MTMKDFWEQQAAWSRATFGSDLERGPEGPLKHLAKEAVEALNERDPRRQDIEIADCLFLVFDAARRAGMTYEGLVKTAFDKLAVNKARNWPKPTVSGEPVEHDRSGEAA